MDFQLNRVITLSNRVYFVPDDSKILNPIDGANATDVVLLAFRYPITALPTNHFVYFVPDYSVDDKTEQLINAILTRYPIPAEELTQIDRANILLDSYHITDKPNGHCAFATEWDDANMLGIFHALPITSDTPWGFYYVEVNNDE
ncbi:MAG: hypothetical protein IJ125_02700 [Atopobiaceae bacterium]|nr:hypothetical protein [Atopobiaceae bacterium]